MELHPVLLSAGRRMLHLWRHSCPANFLLRRLAPSIVRQPVEECPAWKARLCGLKVPRLVRPREQPDPSGAANINIILALLHQATQAEGDLCECGVFRGATLIPTGLFLQQRNLDRKVFGCDSFEGFGEAISIDVELGGLGHEAKRVHGMNSTSMKYVAERVNAFGLNGIITLVPGYFENTLQQLASRTFCYVHLDCDMYDSYRTCMEFFYPRMAPGGIILFDEYDDPYWPGCNKAVDEFLAGRPERPQQIERDGFVKSYVQKLPAHSATVPESRPSLSGAS